MSAFSYFVKTQISQLQEDILQRLATAAQSRKIDLVTRLSALAGRTKELEVAADRIQSQLDDIQAQLLQSPKDTGPVSADIEKSGRDGFIRREHTTLEVVIDWAKNGQPYGTETIREHLGSQTLVKLMERLASVHGARVLETAAQLQINRGPFVSKTPSTDYRNGVTGESYQSHEIPGTEWHVLTHSSTPQKVDDVKNLLKRIGLAPGSYSARQVPR